MQMNADIGKTLAGNLALIRVYPRASAVAGLSDHRFTRSPDHPMAVSHFKTRGGLGAELIGEFCEFL
jgi:hypothetical protein